MKSYFLLFFLIFPGVCFSHSETTLHPFTTDFCTMYPEGTFQRPGVWKHCCAEHDLYYWAGGTSQDKDEADLRLRACVAATGEELQARLIYWGVRAGSHSPITFKKKAFGNGWIIKRQRIPLTPLETDILIHEVASDPSLAPPLKQSFTLQLLSRLE